MGPSPVALGYVLGWALMFFFRVEAIRQALPSYAGAERAAVLTTPTVVAVHVTLAYLRLDFGRPPSGLPLAAGIALFVGAIAFWFWGRRMIGPMRLRRLPEEPPLAFRADGAFAWVRHPLYSSYIAASLAPVVATGSVLLAVSFAASVVAIAVRAVQEERRMRAQLGADYDRYCRRVKRLIPMIW